MRCYTTSNDPNALNNCEYACGTKKNNTVNVSLPGKSDGIPVIYIILIAISIIILIGIGIIVGINVFGNVSKKI